MAWWIAYSSQGLGNLYMMLYCYIVLVQYDIILSDNIVILNIVFYR